MPNPRELLGKKREWQAKIKMVEASWDEICARDRKRDITGLQARVAELKARSVEANEASEALLALDDDLMAVRDKLEHVADRREHTLAAVAQKRADLETARARLKEAGAAEDVEPRAVGAIDPAVVVELSPDEVALAGRLTRQRDALSRILTTQTAEANELEARVEALRGAVAELRVELEDLSGDIPDGGESPTPPELSFEPVASDGSLRRLVQVLELLTHIREARFNTAKQGESVHALRTELNRAKLNMANWGQGGGMASASPNQRDVRVNRATVQLNPAQQERAQSISWKAPPKPPRPSMSTRRPVT